MPRTTRLTAAAAVLLSALLLTVTATAATRPASSRTQTASAPLAGGGAVTATLTYTPKSYYDTAIDLTIVRAGAQLLSAPVVSKACVQQCSVGQAPKARAIHVVDLQGNGEPDVFLDLYTGGAHCCTVTDFYTYNPGSRSYRQYEQNWGDPGYRLEKLGGAEVFQTTNDAFAYAFTDYAASGEPLQLLRFNGTRLVDVTRQHPGLIRRDAAGWLTAFRAQAKQKYSDSVGVVAAWAADEDELGHSAAVARFLKLQAAQKHLNPGISGLPANARFVTALNRFLKKTGYLR